MRFIRPPTPHPQESAPLLASTPTAEHRPFFWRKANAPAALEHPHARDYFTHFPTFHAANRPGLLERAKVRFAARVEAAEDIVEAGCLRLTLHAIRWWLWRRWRS